MFLIYRLLMAYKKSGKEVTCNICGRSFNRIRAIGGSYADFTAFMKKTI